MIGSRSFEEKFIYIAIDCINKGAFESAYEGIEVCSVDIGENQTLWFSVEWELFSDRHEYIQTISIQIPNTHHTYIDADEELKKKLLSAYRGYAAKTENDAVAPALPLNALWEMRK